jgi:RimJ/RimL family protein N-acetyltransferase
MTLLEPELAGRHIRLEPLQLSHVAGLSAASSGDPDLYRMSRVPVGTTEVRQYTEAAIAARSAGTSAPFAVVRLADGEVVGSTRFWELTRWAWPEGHERHGHDGPDTCEIGHTWLAPSAIRSPVNTEMKLLMLTFAFETWQVRSVCFHTDVRNERSRRALRRIGAHYEGVLRAHRLATDGQPRDSARFSITAGDWPAVRAHLAELSQGRTVAPTRQAVAAAS